MGKAVSKTMVCGKTFNNETEANENTTSKYANLVNPSLKESNHIENQIKTMKIDKEPRDRVKRRNVDALLQLQVSRRPLSAFIHNGADGLYVWFISTWMLLKQKHYGKFTHSSSVNSSAYSSKNHSRAASKEDILATTRKPSEMSNELELADISDASSGNDSGVHDDDSEMPDGHELEFQRKNVDLYDIPYSDEELGESSEDEALPDDVTSCKKTVNTHAQVTRTRYGERNPVFSLKDEY